MANLSLKHIYKVYPNGTKAVNDFNMEIKDKEFIVFVGPSGCGKSTTLRMIAGLEKITYGELTIDDEVVNSLEPKERDIAMVFQNYALYPHMSIFENIAFGLRTRKIDKKIINQKVNEAANILGISDYLNKKPKEMSGGQRQRVALGRAIVREPKVMLLDEPLSNLDAKLRTQMRSEIVKLHKKLNTTFIYVTHDQVEAMTMGTRIVVMKDGYIKQIDSPKNLYRYPANLFVASFIGSPQMNFFRVLLKKENNDVEIKFLDVETKIIIPFSKLVKIQPTFLTGTKEVILGIRSENISLSKTNNSIKMKVSHFEELGNETLIYGDIDLNNDSIGDSPTKVIIKIPGFMEVEANSIIDI
ncbi:MAG: ABC transporter ATP-binding protein, partial [Bacilli bacterium]